MTTDSITFNHILGQGRINQLGGMFINGRPLPLQVRQAIISMAKKGVKPCHISRQLKVSHGAVSKILNRYAETGSISPGQIGGSPRARITVQAIEKELIIACDENPNCGAAELREIMIQKEICTRANAPTIAAINRVIRGRAPVREKKMDRKRLSYSIDSILGISIDDCSKSSSDDDDCSSSSPSNESSRRNRTSFTSDQLESLESAFKANTYPDAVEREQISKETSLSEEKIMTWFSNRRARCRKNMPIYQQFATTATTTTTTTGTTGATLTNATGTTPNTGHYQSLLTPQMMLFPNFNTPILFAPHHFMINTPPSS